MSHDVLVLGAGPAGSVLARRLAAAGVRVALLGAAHRPGLEGISDRTLALLAEEDMVTGAPLLQGPVVRHGRWAGRVVEGREWLADRALLAEALRDRAVRAGADARRVVVTRVDRGKSACRLSTRDGEVLCAPLLIDARGRRGKALRGPLLLAMGQRYRCHRGGPAGTRIECIDFGWCWWARQDGELWIQIVARPGQHHPSAWTTAAARQIPELAQLLEHATPVGEPVACAAHARLGLDGNGEPMPEARPWLTGDSAVSLDPLSGQGIYQAIKSARLVATAILSIMNGGDAQLARRFVVERHREDFERGVSLAAQFYRLNAVHGDFWLRTAKAYEALTAATGRTGSKVQGIKRRPVLINGRIVERDVLVTAAHPRGVWQVSGVPLVELVRHLEANPGAAPKSAARHLGHPDRAIAAAMHWLARVPEHPPGD